MYSTVIGICMLARYGATQQQSNMVDPIALYNLMNQFDLQNGLNIGYQEGGLIVDEEKDKSGDSEETRLKRFLAIMNCDGESPLYQAIVQKGLCSVRLLMRSSGENMKSLAYTATDGSVSIISLHDHVVAACIRMYAGKRGPWEMLTKEGFIKYLKHTKEPEWMYESLEEN